MSGEIVYLLESTPLDASGTAKTVCFSAGLYNEAELKGATGNSYPVRLSQAYTHETSIFEDNIPGQTNISLGSSTINNVDGRFDFLLDYAWDARPITIKRGKQGASYASYTTEFVGSTTEITADGNNLVLTLRDNSYKLAKPLQPNIYLGTGGSEGGADLQNKTKPLIFGKVRNLSPIWIDQALLTMQINDGALASVDNVYDRANAIKFQQDYATYALLAAATISPGYYASCKALGYIRLGAPPAGSITVDAVGSFSTVTNIPALAQQVLTSRLGLTSGELDTAAFAQASTDAPWAYEGIYFQEPDIQYDEFLETLSSSVNGFWYVTRSGLVSFKIFKFNTPAATIRQEDVSSLGKASSPAPLYRVKVDYAKNATVQPASDFTIPKQLLNAYLDKMYLYVDTSVGTPSYAGAGVFHAFLNDTEINSLGLATFSVPNGETWISIDPQGNISVTAPPTTPASAVLRVNIGEFAWDEMFTVVKDPTSPLNKIDLSLSADRFYFGDDGKPSPTSQSIVVTATGTNTTAPITITAVDNLGNNVALTGGNTIPIANVSSSVLVQWIEVKAVDANGVQQRKRFVVQHGNDAYAQGILGSYSSSSGTTFFFQPTAPATGMINDDVWVDTDDANKTYRWTGTLWASFSDTRIVDALTAAAGAQATADGKIKTYVNTTAPTGTFALGDLWYNPNTQNLQRWNGTAWADTVSTVGATVGGNLTNGGAVVTVPLIYNSAVSLNSDGSLAGAGGGQVTLGGIGYTGLWGVIGSSIGVSGNKLTNFASGADGYTGAAVGRLTKGPQFVVTDVYAVNGKVTVLALDDDSVNFTLATMRYAVVFTYNTTTGHTVQIYVNNVSVAGPTNIGTSAVKSLWFKYDDTALRALVDGTERLAYSSGITAGAASYPKALLYSIGAVYDNLTYGVSQVQPQLGTNVQLSTGTVPTETQVLNSSVSISSGGVLSGAGGGTVTLGGIAPGVDPNATRNRTSYQSADPGSVEDGYIWGDISGAQTNHRVRIGGVWRVMSNIGARAGTDLFDSSLTTLGDTAVKNSSISISSGGVLSGAGGGTVTLGGIAPGVDPNATRNRSAYQATDPGAVEDGYIWGDTTTVQIAHKVRIGGVWRTLSKNGARAGTDLYDSSLAGLGDTAIKNSSVSISSGGVLSGAGGGTVTFGGLGGGAVGQQADLRLGGLYLRDSAGSTLADSTVKNSSISISSGGVLNGAGGGTVSLGGLGAGPWATETRSTSSVWSSWPNLVPNGSLRVPSPLNWFNGTAGAWTFAAGGTGEGNYVQSLVNGTNILYSASFPVGAGQGIALQAEVLASGIASGQLVVDIEYLNSSNGVLGQSGRITTNGSGWSRRTATGVTVSGTTFAHVRIFSEGVTFNAGGIIAVRRIKVNLSTLDTPFSDEATNSVDAVTTSGSGVVLGDGFVVPPIIAVGARYSYNKAPQYTASAGSPATATITLDAGTLRVGSRTLFYPAFSASTTGTGGSVVRYYCYVDDPTFAGGSPPFNITTDPLAVSQATGRVSLGNVLVTFPTSGGGSGGGTGGGGLNSN